MSYLLPHAWQLEPLLTPYYIKDMRAHCNNCGTWFPVTRELEGLIYEGIITPLDINLCPLCAELEAEYAEYEEYLYNIINEL